MKIISKFRDYYDPIAHVYGADPKIVYVRQEIKNIGPFEYRDIYAPLSLYIYHRLHHKYGSNVLIVGERVYRVFYKEDIFLGPRKYFLPDEKHEIITKAHAREWKELGPKCLYSKSKYAIDLCKLVGQPVFWIYQSYDKKGRHLISVTDDTYSWDAPKRVPILGNIHNFAKFYPADQIYQDLSYVLGNLMHTPPDAAPPVQVDEKVRWVKKGFDSKTSFRGK